MRGVWKNAYPRTPVTRAARDRAASLPPLEAVVRAWTLDVGANPTWHRKMQGEVRAAMPLLSDALDRLVAQEIARNPRCTCPEADPMVRAGIYTVMKLGVEPHAAGCPRWGMSSGEV